MTVTRPKEEIKKEITFLIATNKKRLSKYKEVSKVILKLKKTLMNKNMVVLILFITIILSCDKPRTGQVIELKGSSVGYINTVVYDSCEYIYDSNFAMNVPAVFTHKGNCRYCIARMKDNNLRHK